MLTKEQKEARRNFICGSDAPVIMRKSKYSNPIDLWREKLGLDYFEDETEVKTRNAGSRLEPSIRDWFEDEYDKKVHTLADETLLEYFTARDMDIKPVKNNTPLLLHPKHDWMAANIDGFIIEENAVVEIKTAQYDTDWDLESNSIPDSYACQVAHYCEVTGADKAYIVMLYRGFDLRVFVYEKNERMQNAIVKKEEKFWLINVKQEIPPAMQTMDDVNSMHGTNTNPDAITSSSEVELDIIAIKKLEGDIKALKVQKQEHKDSIAVYLSDKEVLQSQEGKTLATWKAEKGRKTFDSKSFKDENPEMYNQYIKISKPSRRFLVK